MHKPFIPLLRPVFFFFRILVLHVDFVYCAPSPISLKVLYVWILIILPFFVSTLILFLTSSFQFLLHEFKVLATSERPFLIVNKEGSNGIKVTGRINHFIRYNLNGWLFLIFINSIELTLLTKSTNEGDMVVIVGI